MQGQEWDPEAQWVHFSSPCGPLSSVIWDDPWFLSFASPWGVSQSSKLLHHFSSCCPVQGKALQSSFSWAIWSMKRKSCSCQPFSRIYVTFLHWLRDREPGRDGHRISTLVAPVPVKMAVTRLEKSPGFQQVPDSLLRSLPSCFLLWCIP